jgi:hypothetical protein
MSRYSKKPTTNCGRCGALGVIRCDDSALPKWLCVDCAAKLSVALSTALVAVRLAGEAVLPTDDADLTAPLVLDEYRKAGGKLS